VIDLYNGDCLNILKTIPDNSVDMILQDPPYNTTACKWEWDIMTKIDEFWSEWNRIIKPNGAIVMFGSEPFSSKLRVSNLKMYKYDWVWKKTMPSGMASSSYMPMKYHENILVFVNKGKPTFNKQLHERSEVGKQRLKNNGKILNGKLSSGTHNPFKDGLKNTYSEYDKTKVNPKTILEFNSVPNCNGTKLHPTQKPVPLLEYLIKTYTNENETVFDGFMGSGTTGVACKNLNRSFIGIELDTNYFNIAKDRIYPKDKGLFD